MRKLLLLLLVLLGVSSMQAQVLPSFSTADNPVWYHVQFKTGSNCLADQGRGNALKTATKANVDAQKWAFIGTKDNFVLLSKKGNYVNFNSSNFTTSATGVALKMVESTNAAASDCWEIQRKTSSQSMNQWGGTSAGVNLGEWTAGDNNNPVRFVATEAKLPVFSTETSSTFYFVKFCQGGGYLADQGAGQSVQIAAADPIPAQKWKLVGTQSNFQLVNEAGLYAYVDGTGNAARIKTRTTPDANGFSLVTTGVAAFSPNWEIHANGISGNNAFNQWGGAQLGNEIGLWAANDVNNPVEFILPKDMTYADYKVEGIDPASVSGLSKLTLWYTQPATLGGTSNNWMEYSLPIGNGQLGASLFNGAYKDEVQFNEKTLWSGSSTDNGSSYGAYQNFGSLFAEDLSGDFDFGSDKKVKNYYRALDLTRAIGSTHFTNADGSKTYDRTYLASFPDRVIAVRYACNKPGSLSLRFTLKPGVKANLSYADGEGTFSGKLTTVTFNARMKVVPVGGTMTTDANGVEVRNADEICVYLAAGTDFDAYKTTYISNTAALPSTMKERVDAAAQKGMAAIMTDHVADYRNYFDRVDFSLEGSENAIPTNKLVDAYSADATGVKGSSLMLEQLYFAYGRYLEIASSRGVDLPSNLQGIWNNTNTPPWASDIHSNINVQMNYWPAEPTNLSEMHLPFLNYITNMAMNHSQWQKYAKDAGQTKGWTCYTENNIFGGVGGFMHNYVIANAWYATHLWQHYRYTLDRDFLLSAFPTMWSASQFWIERMKLAADGTYECPSEYSPEQGPTENAVAHAQQLVVELLQNTKDAADILGSDANISAADKAKLEDRLEKADKGLAIEKYTGKWGSPHHGVSTGQDLLREWKYSSYTRGEDGHRHQSHLMCLYPFNQVTPGSPYFKAAVNSLKLRSDESTGWSMGWRINLWARAQDGDHARVILHRALRHATSFGTNQYAGGIYYNLYDAHAPFQIDGNFGACAGIAEMLMQSATDTIVVLPALPSVWKAGHIKGLKAIGNYTVDIAWKAGKATRITVTNVKGQAGTVKYPSIGQANCYIDGTKQPAGANSNTAAIPARQGAVVVFDIDGSYQPTGVRQVTENAPLFTVEGRTVTLKGTDVESVSVYDLQGRKFVQTANRTFTIPAAAGNTVVLQLGNHSYKVAL